MSVHLLLADGVVEGPGRDEGVFLSLFRNSTAATAVKFLGVSIVDGARLLGRLAQNCGPIASGLMCIYLKRTAHNAPISGLAPGVPLKVVGRERAGGRKPHNFNAKPDKVAEKSAQSWVEIWWKWYSGGRIMRQILLGNNT
jgi:hypothetical protein